MKFIYIFSLTFAICGLVSTYAEDGSESIFDGKTLDGWNCRPSSQLTNWSVEKGQIIGRDPLGPGGAKTPAGGADPFPSAGAVAAAFPSGSCPFRPTPSPSIRTLYSCTAALSLSLSCNWNGIMIYFLCSHYVESRRWLIFR